MHHQAHRLLQRLTKSKDCRNREVLQNPQRLVLPYYCKAERLRLQKLQHACSATVRPAIAEEANFIRSIDFFKRKYRTLDKEEDGEEVEDDDGDEEEEEAEAEVAEEAEAEAEAEQEAEAEAEEATNWQFANF